MSLCHWRSRRTLCTSPRAIQREIVPNQRTHSAVETVHSHLGFPAVIMQNASAAKAVNAFKADAKSDLYNAIWQSWLDYVYTKKNQIVTPVIS